MWLRTWVTSHTGSVGWDLKSQLVESCLGRRRLTFACTPWPCVGCTRGLGQMEKSGVSLSLCRKTFKPKGNKKFRTWPKKSSNVFRVSGFLCSIYMCVMNILCTFHISVSWVCYTYCQTRFCFLVLVVVLVVLVLSVLLLTGLISFSLFFF